MVVGWVVGMAVGMVVAAVVVVDEVVDVEGTPAVEAAAVDVDGERLDSEPNLARMLALNRLGGKTLN